MAGSQTRIERSARLHREREMARPAPPVHATRGWPRKISDNIAYALLVYTVLQIFVTVKQLKEFSGTLLPYMALVILVLAIIPICLKLERRWAGMSDAAAHDPQYRGAYRRDQLLIWAGAIGLPFAIAGLARMLHG